MKILILGPIDYATDNAAMLRVDSVCNAMMSDGHSVVVHSSYPCTTSRLNKFKYEVRNICFSQRNYIEKIFIKIGNGFKSFISIKNNKFDSFDVIYCYDTNLSWVLSAIAISRKNKAKLVFDITELYDFSGILKSFSIFRSRIGSWLGFIFAPIFADSIAVPSQFSCGIFNFLGKNVFLIPPFFADINRLDDAPKNTLEVLRFCYAGMPGNKEKIGIIVESFIQFKSKTQSKSELHLVGISEEDIKNYTELNYLPYSIHAYGRVSVSAARDVVSRCDFMVIMRDNTIRIRYGFPSKVAEAMCLGIPVISSNFSDISFYLRNDVNGLIMNSSSISELIKSFEKASNYDYEQRHKMSYAARLTYFKYFSQHANIEKIRKLISIAGAHGI